MEGIEVVGQNAVPGFDRAKLRDARRAAGLSQRALAERCGVPTTTIAHWENGHRAPYVDNLAHLALVLGLTPTDLTSPDPNGGPDTLARLRVNAGLTQLAAAERAGLVRTRYSAIERGEIATVDDNVITRIATAFGVAPGQVRTAHSRARATYLSNRP